MNLNDFNSSLPKPFLNPQVNNLTCVDLVADTVDINTLVVDNLEVQVMNFPSQSGPVANPVIGTINVFSDSTNVLSSQDPTGSVSQIVLADGSVSMTGDLDFQNNNLKNVNDLEVQIMNFPNQSGPVPNAPINSTNFFSSGLGGLSQTDEFGATVTYATVSGISNAVMSDGSASVVNDIPKYLDTSGKLVSDSGVSYLNLVQNSTFPVVASNFPIFSDTSGRHLIDSGNSNASFIPAGGAASFLHIDGSNSMTGDLNLNGNNIKGVLDLNTIPVSQYVTNSAATSTNAHVAQFFGTSGAAIRDSGLLSTNLVQNTGVSAVIANVVQFRDITGKNIQDSGIATSDLFLADGSVPMTGNANMAGNSIIFTNGVQIGNPSTSNQGVSIGDNSSTGNNSSTAVGNLAVASGFGGTSIGRQATTSVNNCLAVGINTNTSAVGGMAIGRNVLCSGNDAIAIGSSANASNTDAICIGVGSAASASNSIAMGNSAVNSVSNSCLIGDGSIVNIRPNSAICDLGTTVDPFKYLYSVGLKVKQGSNALSGTGAALSSGSVTVSTSAVNTGDSIFLSRTAVSGTTGEAYISAINDGTSFVITSTNALDASTFSWLIVKPA